MFIIAFFCTFFNSFSTYAFPCWANGMWKTLICYTHDILENIKKYVENFGKVV